MDRGECTDVATRRKTGTRRPVSRRDARPEQLHVASHGGASVSSRVPDDAQPGLTRMPGPEQPTQLPIAQPSIRATMGAGMAHEGWSRFRTALVAKTPALNLFSTTLVSERQPSSTHLASIGTIHRAPASDGTATGRSRPRSLSRYGRSRWCRRPPIGPRPACRSSGRAPPRGPSRSTRSCRGPAPLPEADSASRRAGDRSGRAWPAPRGSRCRCRPVAGTKEPRR